MRLRQYSFALLLNAEVIGHAHQPCFLGPVYMEVLQGGGGGGKGEGGREGGGVLRRPLSTPII